MGGGAPAFGAPAIQPSAALSDLDPASISDPAARARAIAARLASGIAGAGGIGGGGGGSMLGKRKADDAFGWSNGEEAKKRRKIVLPANPDINYMGLLIGPKVRACP